MASSNRLLWSVVWPHKSKPTSRLVTSPMTYGRREPNRQGENNLKKFRLRVPGSSHTQRRFSRRPSADTLATALPERSSRCSRSSPARGPRSATGFPASPRFGTVRGNSQVSVLHRGQGIRPPRGAATGKCSGNVPRSLTRTLTVSVNPSGSPEMQLRRLDPDPVSAGPLPMGLRQQPVPNGRRCVSPDPPTRLGPRPAPARHRCRKRPRLHHSERSSLPCAHAVEFVVPPPGC